MDSLDMVLSQVHSQICDLRTLEYVLRSDDFRKLYDACSDKKEIDYYLVRRDLVSIRQWMLYRRHPDLESYTVKQLRAMGRRLRVKDYNTLNKSLLISEILKCRAA